MISLICPTRNRPKNIIKLLENLENTISNYNEIEIIFGCDEDDIISTNTFNSLPIQKFKSIWIKSKKEESINKLYNNLSSYSNGNYLWAIGDDVKFNTKGWNLILEEKIEEYLKDKLDRLAYIQVSEDGSEAKHPCFPLITKECFDLTHMYFHPQLLSWGADRCLYEIYSNNDIRRVLGVPEVHIEHLSYHDGSGQYDETAKSMRDRFFRDPEAHNKVSLYIIPQQVKFIKEHIEKVSNEEKIKKEKDMI